MNACHQIRLAARRDLVERARSTAFVVSTLVTFALVIGLVAAPAIVPDDTGSWTVAVSSDIAADLDATLDTLVPPDVTLRLEPVGSVELVVERVEAGEVQAGVGAGEVVVGVDTPPALETALRAALSTRALTRRAAELGVDPTTVSAILAAGDVPVRRVGDEAAHAAGLDRSVTLALVATTVLMFAIVVYGQWVLVGVVEEKTNRVVEVVLAAVSPPRLLAGKVLGLGLLGLGQVSGLVLAAWVTSRLSSGVALPSATPATAVAVLVWFVLGYAFYATAFAAVGALVTRQEEAQNASLPLVLALAGIYMATTTALSSDTGAEGLLRVLSLLPPSAPMTMPARVAIGTAAAWELAVSVALMLAGVVVMIRLAARVYVGGLLSTRRRLPLREAWRSTPT